MMGPLASINFTTRIQDPIYETAHKIKKAYIGSHEEMVLLQHAVPGCQKWRGNVKQGSIIKNKCLIYTCQPQLIGVAYICTCTMSYRLLLFLRLYTSPCVYQLFYLTPSFLIQRCKRCCHYCESSVTFYECGSLKPAYGYHLYIFNPVESIANSNMTLYINKHNVY